MSNAHPSALQIFTRHLATLFRFSSVGAIATLVYLVVSNGLIVVSSTTPARASLIGYFAGMVFSFLGQSRFTFRVGRTTTEQFVRFGIMSGLGIAISYGGIHFLVNHSLLQMVPATIVVAVLIAFCSFVVMHAWVFKSAQHRAKS
jgi:putative flippase GtrA